MNKKFIFSAFIALFSLASANSFAQSQVDYSKNFDLMDQNKDGFVTMEEVRAHHKKHHDKMDLNKDGKISVEEAQKAGKPATEAFNNVDVDVKDNYVSFKEGVAVEEKRFAAADTNKDGKISRAEFDAHVKAVAEKKAAARK